MNLIYPILAILNIVIWVPHICWIVSRWRTVGWVERLSAILGITFVVNAVSLALGI